jgi:hypothetical protein
MKERFRPSAALVTATIALVVALAGSGYAALNIPAGSVGTKQLKDGAVTARKVRRHTLLAVDFAPGQLSQGAGSPGQPGQSGTARAYGVVSATGALNAARSKGLASANPITHPATGRYCILVASGIDPSSTTIVATPDQSDSGAIAQMDSGASDCPSGAFEVVTRRVEYVSTPTPTVTVFHKDEGFSFVVP